MTHRLARALVEPGPQVRSPADRLAARFLATLLVLLIPASFAAVAVQAWVRPDFRPAARWMLPGLVLTIPIYVLSRTRHHRLALWLTLGDATMLSILAVLGDPGNPTPYAYLLFPSILASVMLPAADAAAVVGFGVLAAIGLVVHDLEGLGIDRAVTLTAMLLWMNAFVLIGTHHRSRVEEMRRRKHEVRNRRQSALLQAGFGGMAFATDTGRILECSRGFAAIFGLDQHDMVGRDLGRYLVGGLRGSGEREAVHRDGHIFPVEVVLLPYDELGEQRFAVALRDITERRRLQAQLHQADRMATMGQLAAGVAHEINNPLAWVLGNLDMLVEQLTGEQRVAAQRAADGARRVQRIVADLRTFSRTSTPDAQSVDLVAAVQSAVNMVRHRVRDRGVLIEDYAHGVPTVDGDETRIGQVCLNLLVNASEALPPGQRDRNRVEVRVYPADTGEAVVEVTDNGTGIAPEVRHRMFEPFFTTKEHGTGLGLSITRSITASLGGRLEVRSEPGVGTTMRVVLPAGLLPAAEPADKAAHGVNRARADGRSVLVVDDEPDILELVAAALGERGVRGATSATEALRLLEDHLPDAILCDLMMPDKSGMDLHDEALRRWPALAGRFVFITGGVYTEDARRFLDQTRAPVLLKPFKLDALREVVDNVARREGDAHASER